MTDDHLDRVALEKAFGSAMAEIYRRAKAETGYNASYFLQMLSQSGPIATAQRLVLSSTPSEGFTALWERRRLDLTVEAHVLQEPFTTLFDDEVLDAARYRLAEYGYRTE